MTTPTGLASLDARERYLRQQRRGADRAAVLGWVAVATLLFWLFIAGVAGLGH